MEFRSSDSRHVDWVKALKQVFQQLKAYVKQHHMAGPAWNANGIPFKDFKPDSSGAAAPSPAPASAPKQPPGERLCIGLLQRLACQVGVLVCCTLDGSYLCQCLGYTSGSCKQVCELTKKTDPLCSC